MVYTKAHVLNTGYKMPYVGLGTFGGPSAPEQVHQATAEALKIGYRHLDCAYTYMTEEAVGKALAESGVPREEVFVTSKLANPFHRTEHVRPVFERSLKLLGLDYLDLYLIHWPCAWQFNGYDFDKLEPKDKDGYMIVEEVDFLETWKAMEELVKAGLVRSIGVSNFTVEKLQRIIDAGLTVPAVNQVELHPYLQQDDLLAFCKKHNIFLTAYCPLGRPGSPRSVGTMEDPTIKKIAEKHGKSPAQVLLSWGVQRGYAVIPKSVTPARLMSNIDIIELDNEDMAAIQQIGIGRADRTCNPATMWGPASACF